MIQEFYTNPKLGSTVYGVAQGGQRVAFQDPNQLAAASGKAVGDFSFVKADETFNPGSAMLYPDYQKTLAPSPQASIPVSTIANQQQGVNLSGTIPPADGKADAIVAGTTEAQKAIQENLKLVTPQQESETAKKDKLIHSEIDTLLPELAKKSAYQSEQETAQNLPQLRTQLGDINAEIVTKMAAYNKQYAVNEEKTITNQSITGQNAQLQKLEAADLGLLQARALGLQGQIGAAQANADRAVDLKFGVMEDQINIRLKQLQLIAPLLDKEETRQAQAIEMYLKDQDTKIKEQKDRVKDNINLALSNNVITKFYNYAGEIRNSITGEAYDSPAAFFKAAGVSSFAEAQQKNLVTTINPQAENEQTSVKSLADKYPDAGITLNDTLAMAQSKLAGSRIYQQATRLAGGGGGGGGGGGYTPNTRNGVPTSGNSDVDQYANDVYDGVLKLNQVPIKIRAQVSARVSELTKSASNKYESEFEARLDYDQELQALFNAQTKGELQGSPTAIIEALVNAYGKRISKQEIEGTVLTLFGKTKPKGNSLEQKYGLVPSTIKAK